MKEVVIPTVGPASDTEATVSPSSAGSPAGHRAFFDDRVVQPTPGPWFFNTNRHRQTNGESWGWISDRFEGQNLPGMSRICWHGDQGAANARLIVAAPKLLTAAKAALAFYEEQPNRTLMLGEHAVLDDLCAATIKAVGYE